MSRKVERREAREAVARYHEAQLAELLSHAADVIDRFRAGDLDAFDADHELFQYSRAVRDLWKFCNMTDVEIIAHHLSEGPPINWWERGAPRQR